MRHLLLLSLVPFIPACMTDEQVPPGEPDLGSYIDPDGGKSDEPRSCGSSSCVASLCGYDCDADELCEQMCFAEDQSASDFIAFSVTGSEQMELDTRRLAGPTAYGVLDNVVLAGTDLWQFRDNSNEPITRNGLEILYRDVIESGIVVTNPFHHGPTVGVYIPDFHGPGQYTATVNASKERSRTVRNGDITGARYWSNQCSVTAVAADDGGLDGSITCASARALEGTGSVAITGTFHVAPTSIDRVRFLARPSL